MNPIIFQTKDGQQSIIRALEASDLHELLTYANALSAEDTFVQLSGEQISLEEEQKFISDRLESVKKGQSVALVAMIGAKLVGSGAIDRGMKRKQHIGLVHLSVAKAFRGTGVGEKLLRALIDEGKKSLGIRLVTLTCFAINTAAIALYTKVGFLKAGEIPGAYAYKGSYEPEVTMYLPL